MGGFAIYLPLSGFYTWPPLQDLDPRIGSDLGDPILNASIRWWNATTTTALE